MSPTTHAKQRDLFVIHAKADGPFVHGYLIPSLNLDEARVLSSASLPVGAPSAAALERAVLESRLSVVVLSAAYATDPVAVLAEQLAGHVSGVDSTLVPILLSDCEVPPRLDFRVALDFRDPLHWKEESDRLREQLALPPPAAESLPCPYPGMRSFASSEAPQFYGRCREVDEIIDRLRAGEREIYVVGPSGCGKSSLVAAGVLPRLMHDHGYLVRTLRPAQHVGKRFGPAAIGQAISGGVPRPSSPDAEASVLVFIDQLEELFTVLEGPDRVHFIEGLRALRGDDRCTLVLALRADLYGAFMESALWTDLGGHPARIDVGLLHGDSLAEAIEGPARATGVYVEPRLTERMLADAANEPGALPLMQEVLVALWEHRQRRLIRLADYEALGQEGRSALAVTLGHRADATLRRLAQGRGAAARRILLRLVSFGEGRPDTRRQQRVETLRTVGEDPAVFASALDELTSARLVARSADDSGGPPWVDLAHEILISAWPTFRDWMRDFRKDEIIRRSLEGRAAEWVRRGKGAAGLLDEVETHEAEAWLRTDSSRVLGHGPALPEFVGSSRREWGRRRRRIWMATGAAFLVLAAASGMAAQQAYLARKEATLAQHQAALAQQQAVRLRDALGLVVANQVVANQDGDPTVRASLLREVRSPLPDNWAQAVSAVLAEPLSESIFEGHLAKVSSIAVSADSLKIVTGSYDGTARVWNADGTGQPIMLVGHTGPINNVAMSADGKRVATASDDHTARIWNADGTGTAIELKGHKDEVYSVAFSPDGKKVVTGSWDGTARLWNADGTGSPIELRGHSQRVNPVAYSPDGKRVVTGSDDGTARVWNADGTGQPAVLKGHSSWVLSVAFSPDGKKVATGSWDDTARVWNADGTGSPVELKGHTQGIRSVAFSPDGKRVVTGSWDDTARLWNAESRDPPIELRGHTAEVVSVAFSPDGSSILTGSYDGTARVWDAGNRARATVLKGHSEQIAAVAFTPDGRHVVTGSWDHTARTWSLLRGRSPIEFRGDASAVNTVAFSADGKQLLGVSESGTAWVWSLDRVEFVRLRSRGQTFSRPMFSPDGKKVLAAEEGPKGWVWSVRDVDGAGSPVTLGNDPPPGTPAGGPASVTSRSQSPGPAAFSPDGAKVVIVGDRRMRVWNVDGSGQPTELELQLPRATGLEPIPESAEPVLSIASLAFSPGGREILASLEGDVLVWSADGTGRPRYLGCGRGVLSALFSPDGQRVLTRTADGIARVCRVDGTGKPIELKGHAAEISSFAFSPDGRRIVTGSSDHTARVWSVDGGSPPVELQGHAGRVTSVAFSPDGKKVATGSDDDTARVWNADGTGQPIRLAGHGGPVTSVAFSPDGKTVATGSLDGTARVWMVDAHALRTELWLQTRYCLPQDRRVEVLHETGDDARNAYLRCRAVVERCRAGLDACDRAVATEYGPDIEDNP